MARERIYRSPETNIGKAMTPNMPRTTLETAALAVKYGIVDAVVVVGVLDVVDVLILDEAAAAGDWPGLYVGAATPAGQCPVFDIASEYLT